MFATCRTCKASTDPSCMRAYFSCCMYKQPKRHSIVLIRRHRRSHFAFFAALIFFNSFLDRASPSAVHRSALIAGVLRWVLDHRRCKLRIAGRPPSHVLNSRERSGSSACWIAFTLRCMPIPSATRTTRMYIVLCLARHEHWYSYCTAM